MEFETSLSQDEIKYRLLCRTKPMKFGSELDEQQFLSTWNKDDTFYLMHTGGFMAVRPPLPFIGRVAEREGRRIITGNWGLAVSVKKYLVVFFALAWIGILMICFLNPNYDLFGKIFVFVIFGIWMSLIYAMFRYLPGLFQRKQRQAVLDFIEANLLQ